VANTLGGLIKTSTVALTAERIIILSWGCSTGKVPATLVQPLAVRLSTVTGKKVVVLAPVEPTVLDIQNKRVTQVASDSALNSYAAYFYKSATSSAASGFQTLAASVGITASTAEATCAAELKKGFLQFCAAAYANYAPLWKGAVAYAMDASRGWLTHAGSWTAYRANNGNIEVATVGHAGGVPYPSGSFFFLEEEATWAPAEPNPASYGRRERGLRRFAQPKASHFRARLARVLGLNK